VERPGLEADHSLLSSAEGNNAWSYTSTSPYVFTGTTYFVLLEVLIQKTRREEGLMLRWEDNIRMRCEGVHLIA
jgi:hypothetical protein